jgi:hypothetical protein
MTKHYILHLDPAAKYDWDRCSLRDPITADRPGLAELVAQAVGNQSGDYLVAVRIEVEVLEQAAPQPQPTVAELRVPAHLQELVA